MNFPMVNSAERDGKLVARLAAQSPRLRETKMVSLARLSAAHDAGVISHEAQVVLVTVAARSFSLGLVREL